MQEFWMVYGEGKSAPTVKHITKDAAMQEAARLAAKHPGTEFHVLRSVVSASMPPASVAWTAHTVEDTFSAWREKMNGKLNAVHWPPPLQWVEDPFL